MNKINSSLKEINFKMKTKKETKVKKI